MSRHNTTFVSHRLHTEASLTASGEGGVKTTGALFRCSGALLTKVLTGGDEAVICSLVVTMLSLFSREARVERLSWMASTKKIREEAMVKGMMA